MTTPKTSSNKLYTVVIILVGLVGGYIIYSQWVKPSEIVIPSPTEGSKDGLSTLKNLKVDFKILDDSTYKGLITSGESPVNPGVTGKKDLFAP